MLIYKFNISLSQIITKYLTHNQSEVCNKQCLILIHGELNSGVILLHTLKTKYHVINICKFISRLSYLIHYFITEYSLSCNFMYLI